MFTYEYMQHTVIMFTYWCILILDCIGIGFWIYMAGKGIKRLIHWIKGKFHKDTLGTATSMEGGESHESL
ncbi:hypothetical protein ACTQ5P_09620 [Bacillota bacterium LCP21S3_G6]|jgi:hypothetical protein